MACPSALDPRGLGGGLRGPFSLLTSNFPPTSSRFHLAPTAHNSLPPSRLGGAASRTQRRKGFSFWEMETPQFKLSGKVFSFCTSCYNLGDWLIYQSAWPLWHGDCGATNSACHKLGACPKTPVTSPTLAEWIPAVKIRHVTP